VNEWKELVNIVFLRRLVAATILF